MTASFLGAVQDSVARLKQRVRDIHRTIRANVSGLRGM